MLQNVSSTFSAISSVYHALNCCWEQYRLAWGSRVGINSWTPSVDTETCRKQNPWVGTIRGPPYVTIWAFWLCPELFWGVGGCAWLPCASEVPSLPIPQSAWVLPLLLVLESSEMDFWFRGKKVFSILEYLYIMSYPIRNTKFMYVSHIPYTLSLKVILYNICNNFVHFVQPVTWSQVQNFPLSIPPKIPVFRILWISEFWKMVPNLYFISVYFCSMQGVGGTHLKHFTLCWAGAWRAKDQIL